MTVTTTPHLNFRGNARAALEFYHSVFGGQIVIVTYQDAHGVQNADEADQVMFGQVIGDTGFQVMSYDVPSGTSYDQGEKSIFVSVRDDSADEITALWSNLSKGSTVVQDLGPAGFSPLYGMLKDSFGVVWVLDVAVAYNPEE